MRTVEQARKRVLKGILQRRFAVVERARQKAHRSVDHGKRRELAAGEDKIAKGPLFIDLVIDEALIDTLVTPTNEYRTRGLRQRACTTLRELLARGR